ncbi:SRPBCC family protein [Nocardia cyriacigeorgica]|uniref:SRPBCC family protein n=1 Tax=Nocardia cyriacigeorgica TaxID=135487 RepID=UPI0018930184|nr:SRPBCC family protein [Nocardia cyriacigeorgica]MBF6098056.1 SRPBCC family protein [Nocardia cyriacigeorgica]
MPLLTDPVAVAGLVVREVRNGERDGEPTKIAIARRSYPTDREDLWDALTTAERIPRWFLPVTGELKVGGRYQLEGNAGGVIERCAEPESFALTWEMGTQVSWVELSLAATDAGTLLQLTHEAPVDPDMWKQYGPGAVGVGWDLAMMALGLHLSTGDPVDPNEGLTFPTTPEGTEFVRTAATGWAEAAIAGGDEPAEAHAAAEQTITFYTVEPEEGPES